MPILKKILLSPRSAGFGNGLREITLTGRVAAVDQVSYSFRGCPRFLLVSYADKADFGSIYANVRSSARCHFADYSVMDISCHAMPPCSDADGFEYTYPSFS